MRRPAAPARRPATRRSGMCGYDSWFNSLINRDATARKLRDRLKPSAPSHLQLEADANLLVVGLHGGEVLLQVEQHHACVELLDDVVEVDFGCLLIVVGVKPGDAVTERCLRELAK